jgi:3-oxoacyl-[acyl-carrier-protein] synthase III
MRIIATEHVVPRTTVSNADVIGRVADASRTCLTPDEIGRTKRYLNDLFEAAGSQTRQIADGRERPIDLVVEAAERALAVAGVKAAELDFIIFGGVWRGFLVPSSASAVQQALGASGVTGFDVLDACASWMRALQVADNFFRAGSGKLGLVVNCECGFSDDPRIWRINCMDDLERQGGTFTLGEAATAVVLAGSDDDPPTTFHSYSFGEYGDLAVLPLRDDARPYSQLALVPLEPMLFHTRSQELTSSGLRIGMEFLRKDDPLRGNGTDVFVPHAGAARTIDFVMRSGKISARHLVMTFPEFGNTVAASIPLGLSIAAKDGRMRRGDRVFVATVAAGISLVAAEFVY